MITQGLPPEFLRRVSIDRSSAVDSNGLSRFGLPPAPGLQQLFLETFTNLNTRHDRVLGIIKLRLHPSNIAHEYACVMGTLPL